MNSPEYTTGNIRAIEVYKETWAMMKPEFWTIVAIVLIGMIVGSVIPVILMGPMMIGLFSCLIDKVDGKPASLDKLFKGFDQFAAGLVVALIIMVPVFIFIFAIYIPMIWMSIYGQRLSEDQILPFIGGLLFAELIIGVFMTILHSLIIFAFPLIADRRLGGLAAAKLSAQAAWANKGGIAALFGIGILVVLAGYLLFCIGVYLALPVIMMATTVAYRKVFPRAEQNINFVPPPPTAYQGL
jgi:uncharacterized membrane protein